MAQADLVTRTASLKGSPTALLFLVAAALLLPAPAVLLALEPAVQLALAHTGLVSVYPVELAPAWAATLAHFLVRIFAAVEGFFSLKGTVCPQHLYPAQLMWPKFSP
ncbi:hypothetical protein PHYPSEUDO_015257 [Phytophthora pseudosyringae]|uniref:Uncharacterized protein n=1 Tax=Phytophthora pseudosyringae TaxID=221518 RepID=A0A8T1V475_9STRA|nr:hypothetical protein PHYPSEUDO_015257 [Phytophthora pseudosyringae]